MFVMRNNLTPVRIQHRDLVRIWTDGNPAVMGR